MWCNWTSPGSSEEGIHPPSEISVKLEAQFPRRPYSRKLSSLKNTSSRILGEERRLPSKIQTLTSYKSANRLEARVSDGGCGHCSLSWPPRHRMIMSTKTKERLAYPADMRSLFGSLGLRTFPPCSASSDAVASARSVYASSGPWMSSPKRRLGTSLTSMA